MRSFVFSSRRRHTRCSRDWSSDVCSSDLVAQGLGERGIELRVWDLSTSADATIEAEVRAYRPALIHAFHAYRTGPLALRLARRTAVPLVVTFTGTDANHDLFDAERAPLVRQVLEGDRK